jgi:hypothetical protein
VDGDECPLGQPLNHIDAYRGRGRVTHSSSARARPWVKSHVHVWKSLVKRLESCPLATRISFAVGVSALGECVWSMSVRVRVSVREMGKGVD